ncbi:MAG: ATP-binding protein, partial [Rhizobium sp.]
MTSNREKQSFELHPSIIYQLIYSQSGSASKALGELLTNALDARATQCALTLDCSGFKISDDGNGFNGRDQIDRFFKTFGTPHEEGDGSIVGHFRMGRGQIMAWATTHWCSNEFEMLVDVKNRGTDFDLVTHPVSKVKGCAISGTWYEPLSIREVDSTTRELQQMFKYFALPVTLNGKRITTDVATAKWDVVTDEAYIRFTQSGGVQVSNLGMFVKNYPASRFGVNAVVISRVPLQLCMARNEVLEATCKVWAGIKAILTKEGRARAGQESK